MVTGLHIVDIPLNRRFTRCRYVKFDTFHPAVDKGLPVTRVISRFILQKQLAEACEREAGDSIIQNDSVVCDFEEKVGCLKP